MDEGDEGETQEGESEPSMDEVYCIVITATELVLYSIYDIVPYQSYVWYGGRRKCGSSWERPPLAPTRSDQLKLGHIAQSLKNSQKIETSRIHDKIELIFSNQRHQTDSKKWSVPHTGQIPLIPVRLR